VSLPDSHLTNLLNKLYREFLYHPLISTVTIHFIWCDKVLCQLLVITWKPSPYFQILE